MNTKLFARITLALSLGLAGSLFAGCAEPLSTERVGTSQEAVAADNDPTAIWTAINEDGATYQASNHVVMGGIDYWFTLSNGVFGLTTDPPPAGLYMQPAVFNRFVDAYLHTDPEDEYFGCIEPVQGGIWQVVSTGTKVTLVDPN